MKIRIFSQTLLQNTHTAQGSTTEVHVKTSFASGISLFYTLGPSCLIVDEILVAFQYHEHLKMMKLKKGNMLRY